MTETYTDQRLRAIRSLLSGMKEKEKITFQSVIDGLTTEIFQSCPASKLTLNHKALWIKNIQDCANEFGIQMDSAKPSWKCVEKKLKREENTSQVELTSRPSPGSKTPTSDPSSSSSSTCPTLKTPLEVGDRERIVKLYEKLNPQCCWYLEATRRRAALEDKEPWTVESKMKEFVSTLTYVHPALSFILDTGDIIWVDYFNKEELEELKNSGKPVLRPIPVELVSKFKEVEKLKGALEAYKYGRQIEHHPINDPLLQWLSHALEQTSKFFIPGSTTPIQNFLESDSLYYLWFPVNTIFHNSDIQALGKEKTSTSHAHRLNSKRKLSSSLEIEREKIGRRVDTIYIGGNIELGGLEIGSTRDNTKECQDSMLKLPFVLKDMLTDIINGRPSLLRDAHVLGYDINGTGIKLIDVDYFKGNVIRVRRSDELIYPMTNSEYVMKMLSILELAAHGRTLINDTYALCCSTRVRPSAHGETSIVPPSFIQSTSKPSASASSSNSASIKKSKKA